MKIGWNPIYLDPLISKFTTTLPKWGMRVECPGGGCNGLPCAIDPSMNKINQVTSPVAATGAGDGNFCVVTVPKGGTANIVVFNVGEPDTPVKAASVAAPPPPAATTSKAAPPPAATTSKAAPPPPAPTTSAPITTTAPPPTTSAEEATSTESTLATKISNAPHVLFENSTLTSDNTTSSVVLVSGTATSTIKGSATASSAVASATKNAAASTSMSPATVGFSAVVAFALAYLL
jgi:hypothetical protein